MNSIKRNNSETGCSSDNQTNKKKKMEICPHSTKCYRRNPHHFKEYDHPHLTPFLEGQDNLEFPSTFSQDKQVYLEQIDVIRDINKLSKNIAPAPQSSTPKAVKPPSTSLKKAVASKANMNMKEKLVHCHPYNLLFTKVPEAKMTITGHNCVSFSDLICPSLGTLISSLQINFMIDVSWLIEQYQVHNLHTTPLTIIHGYEFPKMDEYIARFLPNVKAHQVNMKDPFGVHHSKIGIYKYENGDIRIVISTANLYYEDWNHYNQALWLSPALPKMDTTKQDFDCVGPTGFKTDFLTYLRSYKLDLLNEWITLVSQADFSSVKVHFIYSTPGKQLPRSNGSHSQKVGDLLNKHCTLPEGSAASWGILAQSSSLGSFGKSPDDWLRPIFMRALAGHKTSGPFATMMSKSTLNIIYPTQANVLNSYFGPQGGGCLPYSQSVNAKQLWLKDFLHVWKADNLGRSRAMPHIKSYCRVSPCLSKLAWCLITSANISKAAWGTKAARDGTTYIRSYEAGVLFLPHLFDEDFLYLQRSATDDKNIFPLMYDLPLQSYSITDEPWCN